MINKRFPLCSEMASQFSVGGVSLCARRNIYIKEVILNQTNDTFRLGHYSPNFLLDSRVSVAVTTG
jgi:hypothetical protein